jgi:hypothetical protein
MLAHSLSSCLCIICTRQQYSRLPIMHPNRFFYNRGRMGDNQTQFVGYWLVYGRARNEREHTSLRLQDSASLFFRAANHPPKPSTDSKNQKTSLSPTRHAQKFCQGIDDEPEACLRTLVGSLRKGLSRPRLRHMDPSSMFA